MPPRPALSLGDLSIDELNSVFKNLSPQYLSAASAVSRQFRDVGRRDALWQSFRVSAPGCARRSYLTDCAWAAAAAVPTSAPLTEQPAAVALVRGVALVASLELDAPLVSVRSPSDSDTCEQREANGKAERGVAQPLTAPRHHESPTCVRIRVDERLGMAYVAFGYGDASVAVFAVSLAHFEARGDAAAGMELELRCILRAVVPEYDATIKCIDVLLSHAGPTVIAGTSSGTLAVAKARADDAEYDYGGLDPATMTQVSISQDPILSLASSTESASLVLAGTSGGEVITLDVSTGIRLKHYVGPCSCCVTAVDFVSKTDLIAAGFSHRVPGNGHRAGGVAWDKRAGARLAAFGRCSAPALTAGAVGAICGAGRRVCLVASGRARVFEIGGFRCEVEAGQGVAAVDMDGARLALAEGEWVRVLDFARAAQRGRGEASSFLPAGVVREWDAGR